ncbi:MAG: hypothetical protein K2V38_09195, partial [Gemmataceae bacterium]|nr:hypothetical protein [Gemmataceae bacterium]
PGLPAKQLDAAVEGIRAGQDVASVVGSRDVSVGPFPAREVEYTTHDGALFVARVVVAEGRVYVVVAGGQFTKAGNANVRRFLDSFEVTDPARKAAVQKRLDEAKKQEEQAKAEKDRQEREQAEWVRKEEEKRKEQARIVEERRREEERLAKEREDRERAERERVRAANEEFLKHTYAGPPVPETGEAVGRAGYAYSFEDGDGPGVRGKALYLTAQSRPFIIGEQFEDDLPVLRSTTQQRGGYTLGGWVRVRDVPVHLFRVGNAAILLVTVGKDRVAARVNGKDGFDLTHRWEAGEGWHHVVFVSDREGKKAKTRLYVDGALVASSEQAALVGGPGYPVRIGIRDPRLGGDPPNPVDKLDKALIVAAIDECVLIGRPLTDAEVRALAGKPPLEIAPTPRPATPLPVAPAPRLRSGD